MKNEINPDLNAVAEHLIEALRQLKEIGPSTRMYQTELSALIRKKHPFSRKEVEIIMKGREATIQHLEVRQEVAAINEEKTYSYGGEQGQALPDFLTKKNVADNDKQLAEGQPGNDQSEGEIEVHEDMTDDEVIGQFGSLKELKQYLSNNDQKTWSAMSKKQACDAFRKFTFVD